jgi:hypothetical protein
VGFQAIEKRHRHVEHDDIRLQTFGRCHQGTAVDRLANNIKFSAQQLLKRTEEQRVIIGKKYAWSTHGRYPAAAVRSPDSSGTAIQRRVPAPGSE